MKKNLIKDMPLDHVSETLPLKDVKNINKVITDGKKYQECLDEIELEYKNNDELRKQVVLRNDIKKAITEIEEIEDIRNKIRNIYDEKKVLKFRTTYIKWIAAASIVILAVASVYLNIDSSPADAEQLYGQTYKPFHIEKTPLKFESRTMDIAQQKYNNGDYGDALLLLKNLPESINIAPEKMFYTGLAYMELNEPDASALEFETIISKYPESVWANYCRWYLALSYLKLKQTGKTSDILSTIVQYRFNNYEQARKLLKKLK